MSNNLVLFQADNMDRLVKAANMLCKSSLVPPSLKGKVEDTFAVLCMGAELGLSPMQSVNTIHNIQGRPTLAAQLMLGIVYRNHPGAYVHIELDEKNLIARCHMSRSTSAKDQAYEATWDMGKAAAMGLATKDNYKKQPMTMLKWRAVTEAVRAVFPESILGLYATEELQDLDGKELVNIAPDDMDMHLDRRTEAQMEVGNPEYIIGNGSKFKGRALRDINLNELEEYEDTLSKRAPLKGWEGEVLTSIRLYLKRLETPEIGAPSDKTHIALQIQDLVDELTCTMDLVQKSAWMTENVGAENMHALESAPLEFLKKTHGELVAKSEAAAFLARSGALTT